MPASLLALAVFVAAIGSGCAGEKLPPDTIRLAISSNPRSLDPVQMTDVNSGDVGAKIYSGLVRFDGLAVVPDLAETWTVSPDGLSWRFRLRDGVRFHNGRTCTAEDVAWSFSRLLDTAVKSPRRWVLEAVSSIAAPSPRELVLELKAPSAAFLALLAMPACYVVPREEVERHGADYGHAAVGTGPYRLVSWEDDRRILLARNADYFGGGAEGRPAAIEVSIIPEPLTQIALLKRGRLDACEVPDVQLPALRADENWRDRILDGEQPATGYVAINTERFPDPRIRRALNLAVDRARIIAAVRGGLATPASGPVPPSLLDAAAAAPPFPFDPTEAKRLLAEAGFRPERPLVLLRNAPRGTLEPAEAVAGYLRDCGIPVRVEAMEFSSLSARINRGDYDLALLNWFADYPDAENFLVPLFHSRNIGGAGNRARLRDPRVDSALEALGPGPGRPAALASAIAAVTETAPWIFLWHPRVAVAVAPRFSGYRIPLINNGENGAAWRLSAASPGQGPPR